MKPKQIIPLILLVSLLVISPSVTAGTKTEKQTSFFSKISQMIGSIFRRSDDGVVPDEQNANDTKASSTAPSKVDFSEARLEQLVKAGKITESQKTAIIAEQKVIQNKIEAAMNELKQWAKDNNIDESYVSNGLGVGFGNGNGMNNRPNFNGQNGMQGNRGQFPGDSQN